LIIYVVGTLAYKNKIIYFEYDKSFLNTGIEISPYKLPLKSGVMICDDDMFEGLFFSVFFIFCKFDEIVNCKGIV